VIARDPALATALLTAGDAIPPEVQQQLAGAFSASEAACTADPNAGLAA